MAFEWDHDKAEANRRKHGVDFADAVGVFDDPRAITMADPYPDEERFDSLGLDFLGRVLVIIWTWRGDDVRMISARAATRRERRRYEEER
jgi:uncharacterized DUF497 family protein